MLTDTGLSFLDIGRQGELLEEQEKAPWGEPEAAESRFCFLRLHSSGNVNDVQRKNIRLMQGACSLRHREQQLLVLLGIHILLRNQLRTGINIRLHLFAFQKLHS